MGDLREDGLEADLLQTRGPGDTRSSLVTRGAILSSHWSHAALIGQVGYFRDVSPCGRFVEFGVVGSRVWKLCDGEAMLISRKVRYFH